MNFNNEAYLRASKYVFLHRIYRQEWISCCFPEIRSLWCSKMGGNFDIYLILYIKSVNVQIIHFQNIRIIFLTFWLETLDHTIDGWRLNSQGWGILNSRVSPEIPTSIRIQIVRFHLREQYYNIVRGSPFKIPRVFNEVRF